MRLTSFVVLMLICSTLLNAKTRKVLFIGNSYIYTNDIPKMVQQLALEGGDTLIYDQSTPGGQTLEQHVTNPTTLSKIKSQQWDVVILQEQSQKPAFPPAQVAMDVYPYARILDSLIRDNNSCTETMFYMTWGRKNGDASNCGFYPPICTYEGMQDGLRKSYVQMAKDNKGVVAPVGAAWKAVRDSLPTIDLYNPDESHPSVSGSYLAACVFYASIFHSSAVGFQYTAGVPKADAAGLQYYAAKVAIDSLQQWQQHGNYTTAAFTYTQNAYTFTFQNTSSFATDYKWNFGDGNTSISANPVHGYAQVGWYNVSLTASNSCFSETTITDSLYVQITGIEDVSPREELIQIASLGNGSVRLHLLTTDYKELQVYSVSGGVITTIDATGTKKITLNNLIPGLYVYKFMGGGKSASGMFSVQ